MAEDGARRRPRKVHTATVLRTERVTPHMIRVVFGGEGLAGFSAGEYTDHYVKLQFPRPGVAYPEPFDLERIRAEVPRDQWPLSRTYTVRAWDAGTRELTIDFVYHGDEGVAGPWAMAARPGDVLRFMGPGGAYAPRAEAGWHLMVGDESALPAIAASLERVPEGAPVGDSLVEAVRELDFPSEDVHVFVHGEAGFVKQLRRHLRVERALPLEKWSISGYWRRGRDEDGWQSSKREWNRQVEEEEAQALS